MVKNNKLKSLYIGLSILIVLILMIVSLKLGSIDISFGELIKGLLSGSNEGNIGIIKDLRMPRVIIAALVGGNLALAGVLLQAVIRNPLADPQVTGISSGACLVSLIFIIFMPASGSIRPIVGFFGGLVSCIVVYLMAYKKELDTMRIVLAGAAINALLGGLSQILTIGNGVGAGNIQSWISGSLAATSWDEVKILFLYSIIGMGFALILAKSCNVIVLGNKNAKSLGFNSDLQMILITVVAVFLGSVSTAIVGIISFVGLVVPHICRILIGSDHRYLIPFSIFVGGALVLLADTIGRMLVKPYEIPAGIIMAVIGAPFFLYLLRRSDM
ncbi:iron ABC transporter permease [Clostridium perfringens]|uniref:FecCD family ABC transporter permease n=1 Tax=Clostridium perfringens TaxID=1502 RepID=UPI001ABA8F5D|nr:iron ABC transporter permease [Clostridium perfringens]MBO3411723.1 iron ABC transporter permease [Clostridium perfringens]MBO3433839.1 iron ABC transporter permease [Clostridium perfringens]